MTDLVLIRIRPATDADASLSRLTREIAAILDPLPWVLIGGQMVAILEAEHGAAIGFVTGDVDALVGVRAMIGVGLMSRRTYGSGWRGILPLAQLGLAVALFVTTATGGPLVIVVEAIFVVGWIAIARLIWSGHGSHDPVDIAGRSSDSAGDTA